MFGKAAQLRRTLRSAAVARTDAIYIGDEMRDVEAAAQAGLDFGAVTWGYASPAALRGCAPRHLFERVEDILQAGVPGASGSWRGAGRSPVTYGSP